VLTLLAVAAGATTVGACGGASTATAVSSDTVARAAAANPITVSPLPGTPDASTRTQVSFLGGAGTQVADVTVTGSSSGKHTGTLRAYSTGTGESFVPSHSFSPVSSSAAFSTSFTVAHQYSPSQTQFPLNPGNAKEVQRYATAPSLTPSTVRITTAAKPGAAPGDLFLAPYQGKGKPGVMITDQAGNLIWFRAVPANDTATNFRVQQYQGKPILTWWQGRVLAVGFGQGEYVLYNDEYKKIGTIRAGNGYRADLHEMRIEPDGTAWIDMFDPIRMNLSSRHGLSNGILTDSVVQKVDIKTGLVMWEWHALGHIALGESHNAVPRSSYPWDFVHVNSIDTGSSGDVLLSARNTWAIYDVDMHSGAINWRLGGSHSSFKAGSGTHFYWQHDAEFQPGGIVSVFDNGSSPPKEKQSRGLLLKLDVAGHSVSLVRQFVNPSRTLLASSQGNTLGLPGGAWLMGYGGLPNFTEYDSAGDVLLDGTLGKNVQDFRTYLSPWSATAPGSPSVAAKPSGSAAMSVSVSWNGATEVRTWRVLAGSSPSTLSAAANAPKAGFQTTITVPSAGPYVEVQALDASGSVLGTSSVVKG